VPQKIIIIIIINYLGTVIPDLRCTLSLLPHPRKLIRTDDAENVFGLLNFQDQEFTLQDDAEIWKQDTPEEATE
jgi:hypothetical protein